MSNVEDQLLRDMGVDPERYEGVITKAWGKGAGGNVNYSVDLTPRFSTDFEAQLRDACKTLSKGLKPLKSADPIGPSDYGLLALSDLHLGQDGMGGIEAQTRHAMELGVTLVDDMLSKWDVGRVGVLLNGDTTNVDTLKMTTTSGTVIEDTVGDYHSMFATTLAGVGGLVNWVAKRRKVDVFVSEGNHDRLTAYHLAMALELSYSDTDRVNVVFGKYGRIYHRWGANQMLFHHGDRERDGKKLELLMSREKPRDFAECLYHHIYTGHVHTPFKCKNHYGLGALVDRSRYAKEGMFPPELRGGIGHVFDLVKGRVGEVARHFA